MEFTHMGSTWVSTYGAQPSTGFHGFIEGLAPDVPPHLAAEGIEKLDRVYSMDSLEQL